jgi:copper homeostasis protein
MAIGRFLCAKKEYEMNPQTLARKEPVRLEVAVDNAHGVLAAARGGAERLELCASLAEGGLTPSQGFLEWTLEQVSIPVHAMLRPRAGNFVYSPTEFEILIKELLQLRAAGAHGVVTGILTPEHTVDLDAMRRIRDLAYPMRLCFHRAFDITHDRYQALEDVIDTGADVLLTSGGAASLFAGAEEATRIVQQAAGRIEVMGGAGVRVNNAAELWRTIPVDTLHSSLRSVWREAAFSNLASVRMGSRDEDELCTVREEDVRAVMNRLEPRAVPAAR